jgi:hypothetical protein
MKRQMRKDQMQMSLIVTYAECGTSHRYDIWGKWQPGGSAVEQGVTDHSHYDV